MINQRVDVIFQALADPSRRQMVETLVAAPASVKELARPLKMSLPAVMRHVAVLEASGLVWTRKVGRVRTCEIRTDAFSDLEDWVGALRTAWERRLDELGNYLDSVDPPPPENKKGKAS